MTENEILRGHFYQGQFLRAEDFSNEQTYHRDMRRRHNLGPHTWGIIAGLELVQQDQEAGDGKDVFIQPGLAVDGYGREILVSAPYRLNNSDFLRFTDDDYHKVWIAYIEEKVDRIPVGYGGCDPEHNRIRETFKVLIDPSQPQPGYIMVNGKVAKPPVNAEDMSNVPPDLSVPYQELPDSDRSRWMIPLGKVHWDGTKFVEADPGRLNEGRQYVGTVGAVMFAPAGQLRLADRLSQPFDPADPGVTVSVQGSMLIERETTAHGNVHLDDVYLDFRHSDTWMRLMYDSGAKLLKVQSPEKDPIISFGKETGFVGIGTNIPAVSLHVMGSVRLGTNGNLFALGAEQESRLVSGSHVGTDDSSSGRGYSISRVETGKYVVSFTPPFSGIPQVVASSLNEDDTDHIITIKNVNNGSCLMICSDVGNYDVQGGDVQNTSFNFIAVGPV